MVVGGSLLAAAPASAAPRCGTNTYQGTLKAFIDQSDFFGAQIEFSTSVYFGGNTGYISCTLYMGVDGNLNIKTDCPQALKYGGTVSNYTYDYALVGRYTSSKVTVCAGGTCASSQINSPRIS